tara:strand:- start:716 stop:1546 length:831 start_codon:yes stop_codon:yes gene_type:complete
MTEKAIKINTIEISSKDFYRLSIQISLNGLSFCMLDTVANTVLVAEKITFPKELDPHQVLKEVKQLFEKHDIKQTSYSEVIVLHRNNLFSLVPRPLFNSDELANYLKFNAKILANDHIDYDEMEGYDMVTVYVPFVNINNYIYDLFGEFVFKHYTTVMVQSLLNDQAQGKEPVCYVYLSKQEMDITVIANKKLVLFNSFDYSTTEDFLYYLLFTLEQLQLDTEHIQLKLFGAVEERDPIFKSCYEYLKNVSLYTPSNNATFSNIPHDIDFTVLNAL